MKKVYQAPKMIVVLSHRPQILTGSGVKGFRSRIADDDVDAMDGGNAI